MTPDDVEACAFVVSVDDCGDPELLVFLGPDGTAGAPVLQVPIEVDADTGTVLTDVDAALAEHGWRAIPTPAHDGQARQHGIWTPTSFGSVASLERIALHEQLHALADLAAAEQAARHRYEAVLEDVTARAAEQLPDDPSALGGDS